MEFVFEPLYESLLKKDFEEIYAQFKSGKAAETFEAMGENYIASKIRARKWGTTEEDKEFVTGIMKSVNIMKEPNLVFNKGVSEENIEFLYKKGLVKDGKIIIENQRPKSFELIIKNVYTSSRNLVISGIHYKSSNSCESAMIEFKLDIPKGFEKDEALKIIILTNYKTYIYKLNAACVKGIGFSEEFSFRTLQEFFELYEKDYLASLKCFGNSRYLDWLNDNNYKLEVENYRRFRLECPIEKSLQNFLQALEFDVLPILSVKFIEDTLIIKNLGKGYLYGELKCSGRLEVEKNEWSQRGKTGEVSILCRGNGVIEVLSNGGCTQVAINAAKYQVTTCEKEYKEFRMGLFKDRSIKLRGLYDFPKITSDNSYVRCYLNSDSDIVIERNILLSKLLIKMLKKEDVVTNVKVNYKEKLYHIKIKLS